MYVLTAVIPVYGISRNFENLKKMFIDIPSAIQVIVVHDTTDGEDLSLLSEIATSSNFTILEVAGGSAGKTRNHALPLIHSEWTVFWDADDQPFPMAILKAISDTTSDEIDLIIGSFSENDLNYLYQETDESISAGINIKESFFTEFGMWRCIFRSAAIKGIYFNDLKIGEDLAFILRALPKLSHKVYFSNHHVYEYRRNSQESVTNSPLLNEDFEEALGKVSNLRVEGDFKIEFKSQILLSLLLSQFRRFPSVRKFHKLIKFCFYNPIATYNKARGLMRR